MYKNMFRHFFVSFGAILYLGACPLLLYQYLGVVNGWPGVFLSVVRDASGDWWLDIDWHSDVILATLLLALLTSAAYAALRRHDYQEYREPGVQSQAGF